MVSLISSIRRTLNTAALDGFRLFYPVLPKEKRKWLFEKSVSFTPVQTKITVLHEDEEKVVLAKKEKDGRFSTEPFKILTTSDIHLGDDPSLRRKAMQMLQHHIAEVKPDLVILTGDIVLSKYQQLDAVEFARFMEKTGVYWAIVFGNHEAREEKGYFKWMMMDTFRHYPHCLARHGRDDLYGYGNYRIDIMGADGRIGRSLFLLDSGRDIRDRLRAEYNIPADMHGYDFIKKEQMQWYEDGIRELQKQNKDVKSMLYFHIPIPEFQHVMKLDENGKYVPTGEARILYGGMYESIGCSSYNSGLFELVKALGSTDAIYCGHDHVNDFCAEYEGVYLIYSQTGGYETYTLDEKTGQPEEEWMQGATLTEILPDNTLRFTQKFSRKYL